VVTLLVVGRVRMSDPITDVCRGEAGNSLHLEIHGVGEPEPEPT